MAQMMQIVDLPTGAFAVRLMGDGTLAHNIGPFESRAAAERWMMVRTAFPAAGHGVLKPGDGSNVA